MITFLFDLPRWKKRLIIMSIDMLILPLSVWVGFALRYSSWTPPFQEGIWLIPLSPLITLPIFIRLGLYRAIIRFINDQQAIIAVIKGITFSTVVLAAITYLTQWQVVPRSVFPIYWGTALILVGASRYLIRLIYQNHLHNHKKKHVLIYGAGEAGNQLLTNISQNRNYQVVAFLDENPNLRNSTIQGISIYHPTVIPKLLEEFQIEMIFLAIPSVDTKRRSEILKNLEQFPVHVRSTPRLNEIISGKKRIDEIREIEIDELLGREKIPPDKELLSVCIKNRNVLVTGAGGSIGSELCRQIIRLSPAKLILFDSSEYALYKIEEELHKMLKNHNIGHRNNLIFPVLGSVQNQDKMLETLHEYQIHTLYHAAAYKHVPLVEQNPLEGITNNTFGTLRTALAAQSFGVRNFVLISTDKAVRPTNIMGASKRIAELILQGLTVNSKTTLFSIVRFGNVLGSSGSVVPLFRRQILEGGPVTLTHPEITRYFMTITEAAQLVIQAGAMAKGGEVFLLDMGESVKIIDLARSMINLSGLNIKDETHPDGDIEILTTGLRPGEKLYEELLIDSSANKTSHPKIYHAHEDFLDWAELTEVLDQLEAACAQRNSATIQYILETYVQGFKGQIKTTALPLYLTKHSSAVDNVTFLPKR